MKEDINEEIRRLEEEYLSRMRKRKEREDIMEERVKKENYETKEERKREKNLDNALKVLTLGMLIKVEERLKQDDKTPRIETPKKDFIEGSVKEENYLNESKIEFKPCLFYRFLHPTQLIWPYKYTISSGRFRTFRRKWYLLGYNSGSEMRTIKNSKYNANIFWANIEFEFFQKKNNENIFSTCKGINKDKIKTIDYYLENLKGRREGPLPIAF